MPRYTVAIYSPSSVTLIPKNLCGPTKKIQMSRSMTAAWKSMFPAGPTHPKTDQGKRDQVRQRQALCRDRRLRARHRHRIIRQCRMLPRHSRVTSHIRHNSRITNSQQALLISRALQTVLPMYHRSLCHLVTKERFSYRGIAREKYSRQFLFFCLERKKDEIKRIVIF